MQSGLPDQVPCTPVHIATRKWLLFKGFLAWFTRKTDELRSIRATSYLAKNMKKSGTVKVHVELFLHAVVNWLCSQTI